MSPATADRSKPADQEPYPITADTIQDWFSFGDIEFVRESDGKICWSTLTAERPISRMVSDAVFIPDANPRVAATIQAFLELAAEEGAPGVFDVIDTRRAGIGYVDPVMSLIFNGYDQLLKLYLDNGFDAAAPLGEDKMTALELCTRVGAKAGEAVIRAHATRRLTEDLLGKHEPTGRPAP